MSKDHNRRILIIDDNPSIHADFAKVLGPPPPSDNFDDMAGLLFGAAKPAPATLQPYELQDAYQGRQGLEFVEAALSTGRPFALAFVDVRMPPGWDGVETVSRIWEVDPDLQVVLCTAHSDRSWEETVSMLGMTDRLLILKKPFDNVEVRQLAVALTQKWRLARQVARQVDDLQKIVAERTREVVATRDVSVFALAKLAESRDPETGEHLERMRTYSQLLARQLQIVGPYRYQIDAQFLEELFRSSPLHDIGKVGIPDAVLLKPGKLTVDEFEVMKQHTLIGAETLESALRHSGSGGFLKMAVDIARHHHERFNGSGYPAGLVGLQIPLAARIVALADVYDALTSPRVYKLAFAPELARQMIEDECGQHFDPAIVEAFRACYPDFLRLQGKSGPADLGLPADITDCFQTPAASAS